HDERRNRAARALADAAVGHSPLLDTRFARRIAAAGNRELSRLHQRGLPDCGLACATNVSDFRISLHDQCLKLRKPCPLPPQASAPAAGGCGGRGGGLGGGGREGAWVAAPAPQAQSLDRRRGLWPGWPAAPT